MILLGSLEFLIWSSTIVGVLPVSLVLIKLAFVISKVLLCFLPDFFSIIIPPDLFPLRLITPLRLTDDPFTCIA